MKSNSLFSGHFRQILDRIHHPVGKRRRRRDQHNRIARDRLAGCCDIRPVIGVHRYTPNFDFKIFRRFIKGGVSGDRNDHLGPGDLFLVPGPIPVGFHCQQDTFGASRRYHPADFLILIRFGRNCIGPQHFGRHGYNFRFVFGTAGPQIGVQGIALGIQGVDLI